MFEFETKEQREAWRVIEPLYSEAARSLEFTARECLCQAAARFDAREATCGIEPLSLDHALLIFADNDGLSYQRVEVRYGVSLVIEGKLTDRGREVLASLNAMCKVER